MLGKLALVGGALAAGFLCVWYSNSIPIVGPLIQHGANIAVPKITQALTVIKNNAALSATLIGVGSAGTVAVARYAGGKIIEGVNKKKQEAEVQASRATILASSLEKRNEELKQTVDAQAQKLELLEKYQVGVEQLTTLETQINEKFDLKLVQQADSIRTDVGNLAQKIKALDAKVEASKRYA